MSLPLSDRPRLRWLILAAGACLAGCGGSQVIVESTFPTPLIEPLPVSMGIIIPDELYNFIYTEDIPDQSLWTIALGDANVAMLEPLFKGMFRETRDVESLAAADRSLDGVIEPKLDKFEFDVPNGERDEFVEVWLQYQITVYDPDGGTVIQWPVSGYGKSELLRDPEDAVQRAAIVAMREAGATISTKFSEQPQVKQWLGGKGYAAPVTVGPQAAVGEPATTEPAPIQ
ncbi:MAG TPA: hypothetical protein VM692_02375 [Gammaproteobacteria bacterium]|nr:hypothetical protein [Gammaproteobacteria bacterium]